MGIRKRVSLAVHTLLFLCGLAVIGYAFAARNARPRATQQPAYCNPAGYSSWLPCALVDPEVLDL